MQLLLSGDPQANGTDDKGVHTINRWRVDDLDLRHQMTGHRAPTQPLAAHPVNKPLGPAGRWLVARLVEDAHDCAPAGGRCRYRDVQWIWRVDGTPWLVRIRTVPALMPRLQVTIEPRQPARRRFITFAATLPAMLGLSTGAARAQEARMPTARDMEGPFYISNVPVVTNLNRFGKPGEVMRIEGQVMNAAAPDQPVPGARLEIWQTDGTGHYFPERNGDYSIFRDRDIDMRGTVIAGADGRFGVMSLFPREYWPRPSHIHYWIRAEGFRPLVTQHYLDTRPGNRPHRTAQVIRSRTPALFPAPTIYLQPV